MKVRIFILLIVVTQILENTLSQGQVILNSFGHEVSQGSRKIGDTKRFNLKSAVQQIRQDKLKIKQKAEEKGVPDDALLDIGEEVEFSTAPIVKDDFEFTLSGMMQAMTEMQRKGDEMFASLKVQQSRLKKLEEETFAKQEMKASLEKDINKLNQEKEVVIFELEQHEEEMKKMEKQLTPLISELSARKFELVEVENEISARQKELTTFNSQVNTRSSELNNIVQQINSKKQELTRLSAEKSTSVSSPLASGDSSTSAATTAASIVTPLGVTLLASLVGNLVLGYPVLQTSVRRMAERIDLPINQLFTPPVDNMNILKRQSKFKTDLPVKFDPHQASPAPARPHPKDSLAQKKNPFSMDVFPPDFVSSLMSSMSSDKKKPDIRTKPKVNKNLKTANNLRNHKLRPGGEVGNPSQKKSQDQLKVELLDYGEYPDYGEVYYELPRRI